MAKFTPLNERPPEGYMRSGERLTKIQATTRLDYVRREIWSSVSKAAQRKEKQQWAIEKPKLDNVRKLRGIYFIDPNDKGFKEIMKKRKETWEIPMEAAMPCKMGMKRRSGNSNRSRYAL